MVKSCECRYREWASERVQEMGMLVTNAVGYRRIDLIDKVIVVAMKFLWVDAYNRSLGRVNKQASSLRPC